MGAQAVDFQLVIFTCAAIICCLHSLCACVQSPFRTGTWHQIVHAFKMPQKSCEVKLCLLFCTVPQEIVKPNTLLKTEWNNIWDPKALANNGTNDSPCRPSDFGAEDLLSSDLSSMLSRRDKRPRRACRTLRLGYLRGGPDHIFHPAKRKLIFPRRGRVHELFPRNVSIHSQQTSFGTKKMP